jgi:DNA helicase HerA-like ATPase
VKLAPGIQLDLDQLIGHRLLIQAASVGGKSWLLRLLCEQVAEKIQIVVLDPEGEFASLRARDFLFAGKDS